MIIEEHKSIFIHIPKNAGNSIVKCFSWPAISYFHPQHDTIYDIKKKFPKLYEKWKKFAIVRNPYDRNNNNYNNIHGGRYFGYIYILTTR